MREDDSKAPSAWGTSIQICNRLFYNFLFGKNNFDTASCESVDSLSQININTLFSTSLPALPCYASLGSPTDKTHL